MSPTELMSKIRLFFFKSFARMTASISLPRQQFRALGAGEQSAGDRRRPFLRGLEGSAPFHGRRGCAKFPRL